MLTDLFLVDKSDVNLDEVVFDSNQQKLIDQLLREYEHLEILLRLDLPVSNKLMFYGASGCGKTMLAKALAKRLKKKIIIVNLGAIVSSKLGETAKNIALLFRKAERDKAVLFFDEFDSLGKVRDYDSKDNGEMKRIVNTLLQQIDQVSHDCVLIAATNQIHMIDQAIRRRFELQMEFHLPSEDLLDGYYQELLSKYPEQYRDIKRIYGVSFAEAKVHTLNAVKELVIAMEIERKNALVESIED